MKELSLYIHIPFCSRKCNYCDFLSAPATNAVQEQYLHALIGEIRGRSSEYKDRVVHTIFIGGGTPSILSTEQIKRLMAEIKACFNISKKAEISMEVNPGTVNDKVTFEGYISSGINRLSLGLQSTNDDELRTLGRIHDYSGFEITWNAARAAGFDNMNIDVMAALPGQTVASYRDTLQKVCKLQPEHISAYSLIIEEGTPFYEQYSYLLEDEEYEERDRQMYAMTEEILLENGYGRYEISNYAKPGMECAHNKVYWQRGDYLGLGIGAASMINNMRYKNTDSINRYIQANGLADYEDVQALSVREQMEEFMFLGLRLTEGISVDNFRETFGCSLNSVYGEVLEKNEKDGLLVRYGNMVKLTAKGLDLSNYVFAQFT